MVSRNQVEPMVVTSTPKSAKEQLFEVLIKQGPLSIVLLIAIWYMATWIRDQIPIHLKEINAGYERIATQFSTTLKEVEATHAETIRSQSVYFEKQQERQDRLNEILFGRVNKRVDETEKRVHSLMTEPEGH